MADPQEKLAKLRALLATGKGSPEARAKLQSAIDELSGQADQQTAPQTTMGRMQELMKPGSPQAVAAPALPPPDRLRERLAALSQASISQRAPEAPLPTAYIPNEEAGKRGGSAPLLFSDPWFGSPNDEGWKAALGKAQEQGRSAYRVSEEWPVGGANGSLSNLPMRAWTDFFGPLLMGADKSLTLGAGSKLAGEGVELAGLRGAGDAPAEAAAANRGAALLGRVGGALVPQSAAANIGGAALKALPGAIPAALAANPVATSAITGAMTGAAQGGGEALVSNPRDPLGAIGSAGEGALTGAVLGPLFSGLGTIGSRYQKWLRNPDKRLGLDLMEAEQGGARTSMSPLNAIKPGPVAQDLLEEGRTLRRTPEELVVDRTVPVLGREIQKRLPGEAQAPLPTVDEAAMQAAPVLGQAVEATQKSTLGGIASDVKAQYAKEQTVSFAPLVTRALQAARKMLGPDGDVLPGQNPGEIGTAISRAADVKVVPATSPFVDAADPEMIVPADVARGLGLGNVPQGSVAVLVPRMATAENVDDVARAFSERANAGAGVYDPAKAPAKELAAGAKDMRPQLGGEFVKMKAQHSAALGKMKNAQEAAGLNRDASGVELGNFGTLESLYKSALRYGSDGNAAATAELDRLASSNPELRSVLDMITKARAGKPRVENDPAVQNILYSAGLPKNATGVDLSDAQIEDALTGALRRYRTEYNAPLDRHIEGLAHAQPANVPTVRTPLAEGLSNVASTRAYQRLKRDATWRAAVTKDGIRPYSATAGIQLMVDPIFGAFSRLSDIKPGLIPALGGARAESKRNK